MVTPLPSALLFWMPRSEKACLAALREETLYDYLLYSTIYLSLRIHRCRGPPRIFSFRPLSSQHTRQPLRWDVGRAPDCLLFAPRRWPRPRHILCVLDDVDGRGRRLEGDLSIGSTAGSSNEHVGRAAAGRVELRRVTRVAARDVEGRVVNHEAALRGPKRGEYVRSEGRTERFLSRRAGGSGRTRST